MLLLLLLKFGFHVLEEGDELGHSLLKIPHPFNRNLFLHLHI